MHNYIFKYMWSSDTIQLVIHNMLPGLFKTIIWITFPVLMTQKFDYTY